MSVVALRLERIVRDAVCDKRVREPEEVDVRMIPGCKINHFGYLVADIPRAAEQWSKGFGAGPFFLLDGIQFDTTSFKGADATFDHAAALGWCGSTVVELVQIREISPGGLSERMVPGASPVLNHIGYVTPEPEAESERLAAMGLEMFLHVTAPGVDARFHDARHLIGCAVEVQRQSAYVDGFFRMVEKAAENWNGSRVLRLPDGL